MARRRTRPRWAVRALAVLLLVAGGWAAWEALTWPDVRRLRHERPATTAFIEQYRGGQRALGRPDRVAWVWTPYAAISGDLKRAVLVAEDINFFSHRGFEVDEARRAVTRAVEEGELPRGASTITQQLAKNVYYQSDDRIARKIPGMAVALKIELRSDKATIMADYLSVVPTGYDLVGAREAACAYFDRGLARLSVSQAAEIAGMLAAPSIYDPRLNPDLARSRRDHVLDRMVETGYITTATAAAARQDPVLTSDAAHSPNCG